jgi:hypothetical protein
VTMDVSIPYSAFYSLAHNDGSMFRHQWWFCLTKKASHLLR